MATRWILPGLLVAISFGLHTYPAYAGMPIPPRLTDVADLRVEAISFFLLLLSLSGAAVQLLWNRVLRASFTTLPRLNYWRAMGLIALWGLLFIVVLTMISGARELMTPGAWEKHGVTYQLAPAQGGK